MHVLLCLQTYSGLVSPMNDVRLQEFEGPQEPPLPHREGLRLAPVCFWFPQSGILCPQRRHPGRHRLR